MAWEENSRICLHMQLIAILSRIGVNINKIIVFWCELQKKRNKTSLFELKYLVGKQLLIKFANEF